MDQIACGSRILNSMNECCKNTATSLRSWNGLHRGLNWTYCLAHTRTQARVELIISHRPEQMFQLWQKLRILMDIFQYIFNTPPCLHILEIAPGCALAVSESTLLSFRGGQGAAGIPLECQWNWLKYQGGLHGASKPFYILQIQVCMIMAFTYISILAQAPL